MDRAERALLEAKELARLQLQPKEVTLEKNARLEKFRPPPVITGDDHVCLRAPHEHLSPKSPEVLSYIDPILTPDERKRWKGRWKKSKKRITTVIDEEVIKQEKKDKAAVDYEEWLKSKKTNSRKEYKENLKELRRHKFQSLDRKVNSNVKFTLWDAAKKLQQLETKLSKKKKIDKYEKQLLHKLRLRALEAKEAWFWQLRNQAALTIDSETDYSPDSILPQQTYTRKEKEVIISKFLSCFQSELRKNQRKVMDVFKDLDTNDDGQISFIEFRLGVKAAANLYLRDDEVKLLFQTLDEDKLGYIEYMELFDILRMKESTSLPKLLDRKQKHTNEEKTSNHAKDIITPSHKHSHEYTRLERYCALLSISINEQRARIVHILRQFDENNDGKLSVEEFASLLTSLSLEIDSNGIKEIFNAVDIDQEGFITYAELRKYIKSVPEYLYQAVLEEVKEKKRLLMQKRMEQLKKIATMIPVKVKTYFSNPELRKCWLTWKAAMQNGMTPAHISQCVRERYLVKHTLSTLNKIMNKDKKRFVHVFREMDLDENGVIDQKELCAAIVTFKIDIDGAQTSEYISRLVFGEIDKDNSGTVEYNELVGAMKAADDQRQELKSKRRWKTAPRKMKKSNQSESNEDPLSLHERPSTSEFSAVQEAIKQAKERVRIANEKGYPKKPKPKPLLKCQKILAASPLGLPIFDREVIKRINAGFQEKKAPRQRHRRRKQERLNHTTRENETMTPYKLLHMLTTDYENFKTTYGALSPKKYCILRRTMKHKKNQDIQQVTKNVHALNNKAITEPKTVEATIEKGQQLKLKHCKRKQMKKQSRKLKVVRRFYDAAWAKQSPYNS